MNTGMVDLDDKPEIVQKFDDIDCITSFEIFEHLVAPYNVLRKLPKLKCLFLFLQAYGLAQLLEIKMINGINTIMNLKIGNLIGYWKSPGGK